MSKNWMWEDFGQFVEVVPLDDDKEHILGDECWCNPRRIDEKGERPVISHNAADGRSEDCCKYHDNLIDAWYDNGADSPTDLNDCGMAGRGLQIVCCENCPDITRPHRTITAIVREAA